MNERIKVLVEQAGYTESGYEYDDGPFIYAECNKKKFAELIIKECFELVRFNSNGAGQEILKHFGVEE